MFQKLNAIAKLKGELENGKTLEKDQLEKIATEEKLMKDLEDLIIWCGHGSMKTLSDVNSP